VWVRTQRSLWDLNQLLLGPGAEAPGYWQVPLWGIHFESVVPPTLPTLNEEIVLYRSAEALRHPKA
jgi:hypothetical protein